MSMWQHLRRTIAESAGAGVRMIPTEYQCRSSSSTSELHCGLCLQDQQKVGITRSHDQCATVLRTVGGRVQIWQFSVLRNRGQNAVYVSCVRNWSEPVLDRQSRRKRCDFGGTETPRCISALQDPLSAQSFLLEYPCHGDQVCLLVMVKTFLEQQRKPFPHAR